MSKGDISVSQTSLVLYYLWESAVLVYLMPSYFGIVYMNYSRSINDFWTTKKLVQINKKKVWFFAAFVVWSQNELQSFVDTFRRQVFGGKSDLTVMSDCVCIVRQSCKEVQCLSFSSHFTTYCNFILSCELAE
jgi:hypothetical protein